jgi:lipoprotein
MIKKNLLFSILIVSISPIFVSTSCKNENKINILENKKMLYTKDILIKNLDNSIKQIRENISNYLKKNNINDIERITKKTDDNYGILPNGQKAKNDVFP